MYNWVTRSYWFVVSIVWGMLPGNWSSSTAHPTFQAKLGQTIAHLYHFRSSNVPWTCAGESVVSAKCGRFYRMINATLLIIFVLSLFLQESKNYNVVFGRTPGPFWISGNLFSFFAIRSSDSSPTLWLTKIPEVKPDFYLKSFPTRK